jgi:hypothetical protein
MNCENDLPDETRPAEAVEDRLLAKIDACEARIIARLDRFEASFTSQLNDLSAQFGQLSRLLFINLVLAIIIIVKVWWP